MLPFKNNLFVSTSSPLSDSFITTLHLTFLHSLHIKLLVCAIQQVPDELINNPSIIRSLLFLINWSYSLMLLNSPLFFISIIFLLKFSLPSCSFTFTTSFEFAWRFYPLHAIPLSCTLTHRDPTDYRQSCLQPTLAQGITSI